MKTELKKAFDLIEKQTVSVRDACLFLDLKLYEVEDLIDTGEIEGRKIGAELRVVSASLDRYAKRQIAIPGKEVRKAAK